MPTSLREALRERTGQKVKLFLSFMPMPIYGTLKKGKFTNTWVIRVPATTGDHRQGVPPTPESDVTVQEESIQAIIEEVEQPALSIVTPLPTT